MPVSLIERNFLNFPYDFVFWKMNPTTTATTTKIFGIFFSFKVSFQSVDDVIVVVVIVVVVICKEN